MHFLDLLVQVLVLEAARDAEIRRCLKNVVSSYSYKKRCVGCNWVAVIPLLAAGLGKSSARGPQILDFYCSKGHRLAHY